MPRNRRPQDREEKREEIIAAARQLFIDDGFESASTARIARTAGVAVNTIYWYFQDKDELLIAVLDRLLAEALSAYTEMADMSLNDRLLWVVDQLDQLHGLVNTVHARVAASPAIDAWHSAFHRLADALFDDSLRAAGVTEADRAGMSAIGTFVIEGLLTHKRDDADKRAIVDLLVRSITTAPGLSGPN
ncbi:TetR/AcrR family transcriptional regulator [Nocardia neocaledoniensis]|uniref:TetR/AcrR family transcriptional regulator n=1 Tax=Nocardia neocaledoniensis TaxID=236511 RepID=UPI002458B3F3|nr:TetR/AcrR family transcriptional regulator [Nocardia neocaledoniensis]